MRTAEEINAEKKKLEKLKKTLPPNSGLGTPNWKIIDLQMQILNGEIEEEDEIWDMADNEDDGDNEIDREYVGDILRAFQWLNGEEEFLVDPSEIVEKDPIFDPKKIAKKIKIPLKNWDGNCYAVAVAMVKNKIVSGKPRYGHYYGYVAPDCGTFDHKRGFQRHGWIELEDGTIVDPTRWCFENVKPYIYVGSNDGLYDIGGSKIRDTFSRREKPIYKKEEATIEIKVSKPTFSFMISICGGDSNQKKFTPKQLHYIANTAPDKLENYGKEIYAELKRNSLKSLIPIDYWDLVMDVDVTV